MHYNDSLYGECEITEPILLDLMASDGMQRSKGIAQHGITALLGITPPFSRFEHAVGVMLLVRRLGASLQEQVAALLHDVSHTAFSHVIDFVFDDHSGQSYHEEKKQEFVASTDIPATLAHHDMDWQEVMDEAQFSLLEQASPALCADRLDYFLRDLEFLKLASRQEIQTALASLATRDGKIVVKNQAAACWLAYTFIEADRASWSSFREVGLYQLAADAIKAARQAGLIEESDIWGTDAALWNKLNSADEHNIRTLMTRLSPATRFVWDEANPDFRVTTKVRSIDPPVIEGNSVQALSVLDPMFAQSRQTYLGSKQGLWPMRVVPAPSTLAD